MKMWIALVGAVALLAGGVGAACNKAGSGSSATASGALSAEEKELLAQLPAGGLAVFGGNAFALPRWVQGSQLGRMLGKPAPAATQMWNSCLAEKATGTAGTLAVEEGGAILRLYARGLTLDVLEECAKDSLVAAAKDGDGKGLTVELPQHDGSKEPWTFLAVAGGVYLRKALPDLRAIVAYRGPAPATTRAQLEADVASLARGTAASEGKLDGLLGKVDRKKALWFASFTEGTSAAEALKQVYGSLSFDGRLDAEIIARLTKPGTADDILSQYRRGMEELRKAAATTAALKPLQEAMGKITLAETDEQLHLKLELDDDELAMLLMAARAGRR